MALRVELEVPDSDPAVMLDLRAWLDAARHLDSLRVIGWPPSGSGTDMNVAMDVLQIVVDVPQLGQLALVIWEWRSSRSTTPVVTMSIPMPDGGVVRIEPTNGNAVADVARRIAGS
jgi:membrane-associated two-gene conflict system component 1 (EACC1)